MKPRCFFIGATLEDNPVSFHFMALAKKLASRGHRVVFLTPHRKLELENHDANPAIYTWPSPRPTALKDARFFGDLIRKYKPDCLIANFVAVNLMCTVGWWRHVPCRVAWYHTISAQLSRDHEVPAWKRSLLRRRKQLVYGTATHLVANSEASMEDVHNVYHVPLSKCRVIYNSLPDPYPSLGEIVPVPGRLVCVGRLYPSKGQDILIRAVAALIKKHPNLSLELIGEGPARQNYAALIKELGLTNHCTFTGMLSHDEVLRHMARAVATVVPSRSEAFGLVNIESMAVGTPVVAAAVGGIVEILRNQIDGFLVPPENAEDLSQKLDLLLANPDLRQTLGANARAGFLKRFELNSVIEQQTAWHENILNAN
jgi:glycosyltransferase involved in cell wall biosynthesis